MNFKSYDCFSELAWEIDENTTKIDVLRTLFRRRMKNYIKFKEENSFIKSETKDRLEEKLERYTCGFNDNKFGLQFINKEGFVCCGCIFKNGSKVQREDCKKDLNANGVGTSGPQSCHEICPYRTLTERCLLKDFELDHR